MWCGGRPSRCQGHCLSPSVTGPTKRPWARTRLKQSAWDSTVVLRPTVYLRRPHVHAATHHRLLNLQSVERRLIKSPIFFRSEISVCPDCHPDLHRQQKAQTPSMHAVWTTLPGLVGFRGAQDSCGRPTDSPEFAFIGHKLPQWWERTTQDLVAARI